MLKWREGFQNKILERGRECCDNKSVYGLTRGVSGWEAVVVGTEMYPVEIIIEKGGLVRASCTCPYAEKGQRCKHMAAVLYCMEKRWPEVMADRDTALAKKVGEYSSDEADMALKLSIDVNSTRCIALLLNRNNTENCFSPDEFTLDDLPTEYGRKESSEQQGNNEPLIFLFPKASTRQRNAIRKKYGLI